MEDNKKEDNKKTVRITFRVETYIDGENLEQIKSKFENTPLKDLDIDFVEVCSVEDEYSSLEDEWMKLTIAKESELQALYERCANFVSENEETKEDAKDILEDAVKVLGKYPEFEQDVDSIMVTLNLWNSETLEEYVSQCEIDVEELCGTLAAYLADPNTFED